MYIRIKQNTSGTSTVMLIKSERRPGKKNANSVILKNFGTSNDQNTIDKFIKEAELYKSKMALQNPKANILRLSNSNDIESSKVVHNAFHDIYGPIFDKISKKLAIKGNNNINLLRNLSILRIANPASKHKTASVAKDYGCDFTVDRAYKLMDKMDDDFISSVKQSIKENTESILKANKEAIDVVFYDLTTIYFETNTKDDLRQFGFSKDGKSQHVQITLALIVTKDGLPIGYELFPGNMYEGHTLKIIATKLKERYNIDKVTVVADSGLLNKDNLMILQELGFEYIIAARVKNLNKDITTQIINKDDYISLNNDVTFKSITYNKDQTIISCHSRNKENKDSYELEEKLKKIIVKKDKSSKELLASKYKQSYIKLDKNAKIIIDENEIEKAKLFHGIFALITNKKNPDASDIIGQYKGLWQIEQSFRIIKSDINIRPIFHWSIPRMKAHFALCYIAFSMSRFLQYKLKKKGLHYSIEYISNALHNIKTTQIQSKGQIFNITQEPNEVAILIYKTMRKALPKSFSSL